MPVSRNAWRISLEGAFDHFRALSYWVGETNTSIQAIALIEGFDSVSKHYCEWCREQGRTEINPVYKPTGRVALPLLDTATYQLVLYCTRAFEECGTYNVASLKNTTIRIYTHDKQSKESLRREYEAFRNMRGPLYNAVAKLRTKHVAHADKGFMLRGLDEEITPRDIIDTARLTVLLVRQLRDHSSLVPRGKVGAPVTSDRRVHIRSEARAAHDANCFWRRLFSDWDTDYGSLIPDSTEL